MKAFMSCLRPPGLLLLALLHLCVTAACSQAATAPESAPASPGVTVMEKGGLRPPVLNPDGSGGELLLTRFTSILVSRADGRDERPLLQAGEGFSLLDPVWSPDGRRIAFVRQKLFIPRRQEEYGSDVLVLNRNEGNVQTVMTFKASGEFLRWPAWTPDSKALLVSRFRPVGQGSQTGLELAVERVELDTGIVTTLLKDGFGAALSPDGRKLAYIALDPRTSLQSLVVADADGRNPVLAASSQQGFERFNPPKFAPDGSRILFAASGNFDLPPAPTSTPRRNQRFSNRALAFNGLPWDLWTVRPDGSGLTRITTLGEDQPWATWSGDGRFILLQGATGRYVMRPDGSELRRLGEGFVHTQIDWR